jgi:hypothetical protein
LNKEGLALTSAKGAVSKSGKPKNVFNFQGIEENRTLYENLEQFGTEFAFKSQGSTG